MSRKRLLLILLVVLLLPGLALAVPLADKVVEHRLANGLRLLVVERHRQGQPGQEQDNQQYQQ
jgi:hypothetical protein